MALVPERAGWNLQIGLYQTSSDRLYTGSREVSNPGVATRFRRVNLRLAFDVDAEEGVRGFVQLPWTDIRYRQPGSPELERSGLADAPVWVEWKRPPWTFTGGVELPLGDQDLPPSPTGVSPLLLQLGSGTFDPFLGVRWDTGLGEDWSLFAGGLVQTPLGRSNADLNPGNLLDLHIGTNWSRELWSLGLGVHATFRSRDYLAGAPIVASGSSVYSLAPALAWNPAEHLRLFLQARIPVLFQVRGTQIVPGPSLSLQAGWDF